MLRNTPLDLVIILVAKFKLPAREHLSSEGKRGRDEGFEEGYYHAQEDFEITYLCSVCGRPIDMKPGGEGHKAMVMYMKEKGWGHKSCAK